MRLQTITIFVLITAMLFSCHPKSITYEKDFPIHIGVAGFAETDQVISSISSLADSISYVRLETDTSAMIGYGHAYEIPGGYLVLSDSKLFFFDENGKYLRKIDHKGRGPGEYRQIFPGFGLDRQRQRILLPDMYHSLLTYDFDGQFISSFQIDNDHQLSGALSDGSCFTGSMMCATPNTVYSYEGEKCAEDTIKICPDEIRSGDGDNAMYFYRQFIQQTDNGLWVSGPDTTWIYTSCQDRIPFLVINPFPNPKETVAYIYTLASLMPDYFAIQHKACGFYSLKDRQTYRIKSAGRFFSLEDDIDQGPPVTISNAHQGRMLQLVPAVELLYPDDSTKQVTYKLRKVIDELDENDNPVLRVVWLKERIGN